MFNPTKSEGPIRPKNKSSVRHSFYLTPRDDAFERSHNASQLTDRSTNSPRILNSQRRSPRQMVTQRINRSIADISRDSNRSYLDSSCRSFGKRKLKIISTRKSSITMQNRKSLIDRKPSFGFSFYKIPNTQHYNERILNAKFLPGKRGHFLNDIYKMKKFVPSPDKYEVMGNMSMQNPEKRRFSKIPRLTIAEEIIKKGASTPGPGSYKPDYIHLHQEGEHKDSDRSLGFIDEAMFKGKSTPLCHDANFKQVEKKPRSTLFMLSRAERSVKNVKKSGLSPCSYNPLDSFKKTQISLRKTGFGNPTNIPTFSDEVAKLKKFVPPPGAYDISKAELKVYKPFTRKRR
ncbi:unnamed protein product [Moneuplotes crassus]|uniref:Uncharacterized protein n=1 Tax=Euplotes crassus TaxID=5936 RepID=A0AAD1XK44_EUPCR|nr:unnamed protein product [Moneuplotes crassus]